MWRLQGLNGGGGGGGREGVETRACGKDAWGGKVWGGRVWEIKGQRVTLGGHRSSKSRGRSVWAGVNAGSAQHC